MLYSEHEFQIQDKDIYGKKHKPANHWYATMVKKEKNVCMNNWANNYLITTSSAMQ